MNQMKENKCLACGHLLDCAAHVGDGSVKPSSGDCTICIKCGHVMIFTDELMLREMNAQEQKEIESDPRVAIVIAGIKKIHGIVSH